MTALDGPWLLTSALSLSERHTEESLDVESTELDHSMPEDNAPVFDESLQKADQLAWLFANEDPGAVSMLFEKKPALESLNQGEEPDQSTQNGWVRFVRKDSGIALDHSNDRTKPDVVSRRRAPFARAIAKLTLHMIKIMPKTHSGDKQAR